VSINGVRFAPDTSTGQVIAYGLRGNDRILVAANVKRPTLLDGGQDNDTLRGGAAHDVLMGREGDDVLIGRAGRDLLIGGLGADRLRGKRDDDILIAGRTAHDDNSAELAAIMAEWTSTQTYAIRVADLQDNNGGFALVAEGPAATVFDDAAEDRLDWTSRTPINSAPTAGQPTGNRRSELDWLFANLDVGVRDRVRTLRSGEVLDELE